MKTIQHPGRSLGHATLVAAVTSLMLVPISTLAQEKGAERLMTLHRPPPPRTDRAETPHDPLPVSCPPCHDVTKQLSDRSAKGGAILVAGGRPLKSVVQHQCEGCLTTLGVTGHGKAKSQTVRHTCTAREGQEKDCCPTTGGLTPPPGR